jgi:ribosomal-protein-alanine N-acetyltransferase
MPFAVRPLTDQDIPQSVQIERDAFPTLFPPTSFHRELRSRRASYLVAWRPNEVSHNGRRPAQSAGADSANGGNALMSAILKSARQIMSPRDDDANFIAGFLGIWYMVDEAHIVSVGVRSACRGCGIGELLLIGAIEQAMLRPSQVVTLEVRSSNGVAMNLYHKYGFTERGIRKAYYADNREDATIMTTGPIQQAPYRDLFQKRALAHRQRWGISERLVV